ncbi:MAG: tRNA (adenosine(37)-N6)-threonylcarbamoyltransferase complex transferase subunit TsaD [Flavobacteriales bacterium]|nr:tRNA (adenosine(37)-N6)-threonylcarbamoyltransferase complex transferase subunit TsaD [Flavobacteriales bacterium]
MEKDRIILGIESSCDDTGAAIMKNGKILANVIADQKVHAKYGGVVPELASRAHQKNIVPTVQIALEEAGVKKEELSAIAYTKGPGLMGSLLVGTSFAKSMAMSLGIPSIGVDHMRGHIFSHFIDQDPPPAFPFLSLVVSGGHTQLVMVRGPHDMELIGKTLDDAAGEAFDKTAKMLGLPYPGGPIIDRKARSGTARFSFNKPRIEGLDMSFSGLKTSILYFLRDEKEKDPGFIEQHMDDICASVQSVITEILMEKLEKAIRIHRPQEIALAGGVAANSQIREAFEKMGKTMDIKTHIPPFKYCTDNAAMIAMVGDIDLGHGRVSSLDTVPITSQSIG